MSDVERYRWDNRLPLLISHVHHSFTPSLFRSHYSGLCAAKKAEYDRITAEYETLNARWKEMSAEMASLPSIDDMTGELKTAKYQLGTAQSRLKHDQDRVKELEGAGTDRLFAFGGNLVNMMKEMRTMDTRGVWKGGLPIGPIGKKLLTSHRAMHITLASHTPHHASHLTLHHSHRSTSKGLHVKLRDPERWALAIDAAWSAKTPYAFIVQHRADIPRLLELFRRFQYGPRALGNNRQTGVYEVYFARYDRTFDCRTGMPEQNKLYTTVYEQIEVDNELVLQVLGRKGVAQLVSNRFSHTFHFSSIFSLAQTHS